MMRTLFTILLIGVTVSACAQAAAHRTTTAKIPARPRDRPPIETASVRPPAPPAPVHPPAGRADDGPLTAKIDANTPAGRSAALRLIEQGRHRLADGDAARAIELFERAVAVDARVPYSYYFLAKAHAEANHPALAHRFLDRAEQKLANEPYWLSEALSLRGALLAEEGKTPEAEAAYRRALEAWPGNRAAAQALTARSRRDKEAP